MDDVGIFAPLYSNPEQRKIIDKVSSMNFVTPIVNGFNLNPLRQLPDWHQFA